MMRVGLVGGVRKHREWRSSWRGEAQKKVNHPCFGPASQSYGTSWAIRHLLSAAEKPDALVILADPWSSRFTGWDNPKLRTPHMDRIRRSMRRVITPRCSIPRSSHFLPMCRALNHEMAKRMLANDLRKLALVDDCVAKLVKAMNAPEARG
jgi:hypothetical protein